MNVSESGGVESGSLNFLREQEITVHWTEFYDELNKLLENATESEAFSMRDWYNLQMAYHSMELVIMSRCD